jgi:mannose-6-phosphate isomerase-like protein (cupin superfamily)
MESQTDKQILDFGATEMWWEITRSTADTAGEYFEAINVIVNPEFGGPPLHAHPTAEESYAVTQGELEVCVAGVWRTLKTGESATVPAGVAHTLRNTSGAEVRLINTHKPALEFERFFRRMHAMIAAGTLALPPRGLGQLLRISMLFTEHPREIVSVKPPRAVMSTLALVGRMLGIKLPP